MSTFPRVGERLRQTLPLWSYVSVGSCRWQNGNPHALGQGRPGAPIESSSEVEPASGDNYDPETWPWLVILMLASTSVRAVVGVLYEVAIIAVWAWP